MIPYRHKSTGLVSSVLGVVHFLGLLLLFAVIGTLVQALVDHVGRKADQADDHANHVD